MLASPWAESTARVRSPWGEGYARPGWEEMADLMELNADKAACGRAAPIMGQLEVFLVRANRGAAREEKSLI